MSEAVDRVVWALPLVLVIGVAAIILIKRFAPAWASPSPRQELRLRESLALSDRLTLHWVDAGGQSVLVAESQAAPVIQVLAVPAAARLRSGGPWSTR